MGGRVGIQGCARAQINTARRWHTWKQPTAILADALRATLIGCWMGITPGGATPGVVHELRHRQRFSKDGEKFGQPAR